MRVTWKEIAVFAVLTVIWGTTWAAIRITLEGIPPVTGVALGSSWWRSAISAASASGVSRARGASG